MLCVFFFHNFLRSIDWLGVPCRHKFATDFEVLKQRNYVHKFSRKNSRNNKQVEGERGEGERQEEQKVNCGQ